MPILVVLALVVPFVFVRRLLEPACPGCSAKSWASQTPTVICCTRCGWSSSAPAPGPPAQPARAQYEMFV
jgi:hypothetical protein